MFRIKTLLMILPACLALMPVSVYGEEISEEPIEMTERIGHENTAETEIMNRMNPVSDDSEEDEPLSFAEEFAELNTGSDYQLQLNFKDNMNQNVRYEVSDSSVITVDENGLVHALSPGNATVRAVSEDGLHTDECEIAVIPVYVEEITLSQIEADLVYGNSIQLSASVSPADATDRNIIWESDNENIAIVNQNGIITAKNPGIVMIHAYSADGNAAAGCAVRVMFTDIQKQSSYYYEPVYWALQHNITNGTGGGLFSADLSCTREQIVTFLWRSAGSVAPQTKASFTDLKEGAYYMDAVSWAAENGITNGLGDGSGRFGVGMPCTREMGVTFLHRAAGSPSVSSKSVFSDVKAGKYYHDAVVWAYENQITNGLGDGSQRFGIGVDCTRAMVVTFLYRQKNDVNVWFDHFETAIDQSGRSYQVYYRNGQLVKSNFKLNQTYYQVDPDTGEIIHSQPLFTDEIFMEGIDISEHNGEINLKDYENGFVIIRVAWGTNTDVLAKRNMDLCEKLKIPYGVYLYSYAINDEQAEWEADYMLDLIKGRDIKLGVWFDIENDSYKAARIPGWPNASVVSRHCSIFCDKLSAAGYHTGIYSSASWFDAYIKGLNRYDRWIAHWGYNDGTWQVNLNGECSIHQYTSIPLDRDVFYIDPQRLFISD